MASAEFDAGLDAREAMAWSRTTAMMCAEALWWRCHRLLVSDALAVRGWEVAHVGSNGGATRHQLTPFAAIEEGTLTYAPKQSGTT